MAPAFFVAIAEKLFPGNDVLVMPVTWTEKTVPLGTQPLLKPKVSVVPSRDTVGSTSWTFGDALTVPSTGVPSVPLGTVIVVSVSVCSDPVVNPYV